MSAISLNLADIRNLLAALGKERSETISTKQALEIIASGLGVSSRYLTTFSEVPGKPDQIGVALSRNHLLDLMHAVSVNNTAAMKNTQRLELLASVVHQPADAMMHKLKASEETRQSHTSLDSSANPLPALRLDDVTFEHATRWQQAIERQDGLYVVSGTPWATRSVVVPTLSQMVLDHSLQIAAFNFTDLDLLHPKQELQRWKTRANTMVQQVTGHCQIVCLYDARDAIDMDIAIEWGRKFCTVVTVHSNEALESLLSKSWNVAPRLAEQETSVTILHVSDPADDYRFTRNLISRFERLII